MSLRSEDQCREPEFGCSFIFRRFCNLPPFQRSGLFEEVWRKSRQYPKIHPNKFRLCAVDYYTLQFYDIILAPFAASLWLAAFSRVDSGKHIH